MRPARHAAFFRGVGHFIGQPRSKRVEIGNLQTHFLNRFALWQRCDLACFRHAQNLAGLHEVHILFNEGVRILPIQADERLLERDAFGLDAARDAAERLAAFDGAVLPAADGAAAAGRRLDGVGPVAAGGSAAGGAALAGVAGAGVAGASVTAGADGARGSGVAGASVTAGADGARGA